MQEGSGSREFCVRWKQGGHIVVKGDAIRADEPDRVRIVREEGKWGDPSHRQITVGVFNLADIAGIVEKCCIVAPPLEPAKADPTDPAGFGEAAPEEKPKQGIRRTSGKLA